MRYWVYINNSVLERPFSREELPSIIGFTRETLIFPEVAIPGQPQEWLPARMLLEPQIQQTPVFPQPYYNPMPAPREQYPAPEAAAPSADPVLIEKLDSLYKELQEIKDKLYSMDAVREPYYGASEPEDLQPAEEVEAYQDTLQNVYEEETNSAEQPVEAITVSEDFSEEEIQDIPAEDFAETHQEDIIEEQPKAEKHEDKPLEEVVEVGEEASGSLEDDNFLQDAIKTTFTKRSKGKKDTKSEDIIIDLAKRDSAENTLTGQKTAEEPSKDEDDDIPSVDVNAEEAADSDLSQEEKEYFAHADEDTKAKTLHAEQAALEAAPVSEEAAVAEAAPEAVVEEDKFYDIPQEVPAAAEVDPEINTDRSPVTEEPPVLDLAETEAKTISSEEEPLSVLEEEPQPVQEDIAEPEIQEEPIAAIEIDDNNAALEPQPVFEDAPLAEQEIEPVFEETPVETIAEQEQSFEAQPEAFTPVQEQEPEAELLVEEDPEAAKSQYDNLNIEKTESIEEKSVLEEFAAEKHDKTEPVELNAAAQEELPAEGLAEALEEAAPVQQEQQELSALDELTGRTPLHQDPQMAPQEESIEDQFLKTFTSSIEEVFLDQPTAIISDYVPPEIANPNIYDQPEEQVPVNMASAQEESGSIMDLKASPMPESETDQVRKVRRIKPAAIKTVPMVAENGVDIQNLGATGGNTEQAPNIDEAIAELGGSSFLLKFVKMFSALLALLLIFLLFVALLATMKIIPSSMSPAHALITKVFGDKEEEARKAREAAMIDQAALDTVKKAEDAKKEAQAEIIYRVKNYVLPEGRTLLEKVELNHHNQLEEIEWSADQAVDPNYYSVAIKLPPNQEGYSLTYRFSYDKANSTLVPTTSEANNLIQPPVRQASAAEVEAAKTLMPSDLAAASNAAPPKVRAPIRKR